MAIICWAILLLIIGESVLGAPSTLSTSHRSSHKIIGGFKLNITQAPWQVSLVLNDRGSHKCGGSIISDQWILTSGKCLIAHEEDWSDLQVRVGSVYKDKEGDIFEVDKVILHPWYYGGNMDYDYGLILLDGVLQFNERVQPIKMTNEGSLLDTGKQCLSSGWGLTAHTNQSNDILRGVELSIVNQQLCRDSYKKYMHISSRMVCAGDFSSGGIGPCNGDEGGPLVAYDKFGKNPIVVGIYSWGKCAQPKYPGVFSRVAEGRDWIRAKTKI